LQGPVVSRFDEIESKGHAGKQPRVYTKSGLKGVVTRAVVGLIEELYLEGYRKHRWMDN